MDSAGLLRDTLTIILAGGQGERLYPLTRDRAKPAVPFGGIYRIIDFTLSNCLNSGCERIYVLTQYKSFSLDRHLILGWSPVFNHRERGSYLHILPPQMRSADTWYLGTADAIFQNVYSLQREKPARVLVLAGDHIYKMNYAPMVQHHVAKQALLTVACVPVAKRLAGELGIAVVDAEQRITGFREKPRGDAPTIPGDPEHCLASMGIYVFSTDELVRRVSQDAKRGETESAHDFGRNIIPEMVAEGARVCAYPFRDENRKDISYWRDVGTIDSYYEANLDLIQPDPVFNLYDTHWPVHTWVEQDPPAKFIHNQKDGRRGQAIDSIVAHGCIVSGGTVERCILSRQTRINSYSHVSDSILMEGVNIGRRARVRRAVVDKGVHLPEGATIGYDAEADRKLFTVTPNGIVIVPKEMALE